MVVIFLIIFVCLQAEIFYLVYKCKEFDKTMETQGRWILELSKKIEDVIYDEKKETEEINKILSDMLNYPVGDNPYQE